MASHELMIAKEAARLAGHSLLRARRGGRRSETNVASSIANEALNAEVILGRAISDHFPDDSVLGSEYAALWATGEGCWYLDVHAGGQELAVSLMLERGGRPELAVVYDPVMNELFEAERGQGAVCNHRPLHVPQVASMADALVATSSSRGQDYASGQNEAIAAEVEARFPGIRATAPALGLCAVAAGRREGFWATSVNPWGALAAAFIVQEAGGRVTDVNGGPFDVESTGIVASSDQLHPALSDAVTLQAEPFADGWP